MWEGVLGTVMISTPLLGHPDEPGILVKQGACYGGSLCRPPGPSPVGLPAPSPSPREILELHCPQLPAIIWAPRTVTPGLAPTPEPVGPDKDRQPSIPYAELEGSHPLLRGPRAVISRWAPVGWPGERGADRSRARCLRGAHPPLRGAASALGVTPPPTVQPGLPRAAAGWFAAGLPVVSPTNHVLIEVGSKPYKPAPGRPESRPWGRGHCAQARGELPGPSGVSPPQTPGG